MTAPKKPAKTPTKALAASEASQKPEPRQAEAVHVSGGLDEFPVKAAPLTLRIIIRHTFVLVPTAAGRPNETAFEGQLSDVEVVLPDGSGFADVGREASRAAQRTALLAALAAQSWNLSAVARELKITDTSAVIRALKTLAPDEYRAAKLDGRIAPGRRKNS